LGHAFAAYCVFDFAKATGGEFLLRIEDTDQTRCRPEFERAIFEDLSWLGLTWPEPVRRQSDYLDVYETHVADLTGKGLTYPCFCSRKEILDKVRQSNTPLGPDGPIYPGTCRGLSEGESTQRIADGVTHALRLDLQAALKVIDGTLEFHECEEGPSGETGILTADPQIAGDIVLARKGSTTSYHVSVVVDDHLQAISDVVRGQDLFSATHIHRLLQALWNMPPPNYHHHRLILDENARRLSKRDGDLALGALRKSGLTPQDIRKKVMLEKS